MRTALSRKDLDLETQRAQQPPPPAVTDKLDSYPEKIIKNIPSEVIAFYIPAIGAAAAGKDLINYDFVIWVIFLVALVGTFVYMRKTATKDLIENKVTEHIGQKVFWKSVLATVAFLIWALYLGGPFVSIAGYSTYGTLLILGYTFFTPAIYDAIPIPFPSLRGKK